MSCPSQASPGGAVGSITAELMIALPSVRLECTEDEGQTGSGRYSADGGWTLLGVVQMMLYTYSSLAATCDAFVGNTGTWVLSG